ncbi:MAG: cation:proton antiporter subunit C [Chloroflexi bacterium]|nr:cation:proton antiporter subunit C [Chloroflexota bacterium]
MLEEFLGRYSYFMIAVLMTIGIYGMLAKRNLIKKLIGMNILQTAIFLFFIEGGGKLGATVPVIDPQLGNDPAKYINPLPHVLMLTGIVVGISLTAVALAFLINISRTFHSLDEDCILKEMSK